MFQSDRRTFSRVVFLWAIVLWASFALLAQTAQAQTGPVPLVQDDPSGVAGYDYQRPSFPQGTRILFLGDSITDMNWGRNEQDRNHYLGHSYVFLIASRLNTDLPQAKLEFFNRGISGNTVGDLKNRWQTDAIEMKPDILSILIGVNDVGRACRAGQEVDLKQWEADYRFLLDASRTANPKLKIVLLDPFVLPVTRLRDQATWTQWNGQCTELRRIVKRIAADYQAVHVRTQEVFDRACEDAEPSHWIWDGVHPLPQGHELIARNWIEAIRGQRDEK
jgi:lysophospholipase L1-like esterase